MKIYKYILYLTLKIYKLEFIRTKYGKKISLKKKSSDERILVDENRG